MQQTILETCSYSEPRFLPRCSAWLKSTSRAEVFRGSLLVQCYISICPVIQHFYTPLAEKILDVAERQSSWPNCLVCSTRPSTSRRGEIVLDIENISFANIAMK